MDRASGPELVAAVTNAGGLGVVGGFGYTPKNLRLLVCPIFKKAPLPTNFLTYRAPQIEDTKKLLHRKDAPFGVDLLLPQVGGNARKRNVSGISGSYHHFRTSKMTGRVVYSMITPKESLRNS